jgi:antitoxin HigA-1
MLEELSLSVARTAQVLGVRRATLSDLVNGHASLSPEMALRVEKAFGVSMDTLLRMQAWHDSHIMREKAGEIDIEPYEPAETKRRQLSYRGLLRTERSWSSAQSLQD